MKVIFLQDYGGKEIGNKRYAKGEIVDAESVLERYITDGVVELIPEPEVEQVAEALPSEDQTPLPVPPPPKKIVINKRSTRRSK